MAARFGVNRNTVRQALSTLAGEELIVTRQGVGTFVVPHTVLVHRIRLRTRLSESIGDHDVSTRRLLAAELVREVPDDARERLRLGAGGALRVDAATDLRGSTIARSTAWMAPGLVPGFETQLASTGSVTRALRAVGVDDYVRSWSRVSARVATGAENTDLGLPPGSTVLVVRSLDTLPDGTPLQYSLARFRADRVELDVQADLHAED